MILKRAETYLTIFSSISIFLLVFTWNKTSFHPKQSKIIKQEALIVDDFKVVTLQDKRGHKWSLGEIRRNPLKQKFQNVSYEDLPKLSSKINNSINTPDLIGTINRTNQVRNCLQIMYSTTCIYHKRGSNNIKKD